MNLSPKSDQSQTTPCSPPPLTPLPRHPLPLSRSPPPPSHLSPPPAVPPPHAPSWVRGLLLPHHTLRVDVGVFGHNLEQRLHAGQLVLTLP